MRYLLSTLGWLAFIVVGLPNICIVLWPPRRIRQRVRGMQFRLRTLLLAATILPPLIGFFVHFHQIRVYSNTNQGAARSFLVMLHDAVTLYRLEVGEYPPNLNALHSPVGGCAPILQHGLPLDPWGRAYRYERLSSPAADFRIWSCGPDGISGTDDDIEAETKL
jgi:general secretion pathway protein G